MRSLLVVLAVVSANSAWAAAPTLIPVTGNLTDVDGVPIDGTVDLDFDLYATPTDTVSHFHEAVEDVVVENGRFTVYLGETSTLDLGVFRDYGTLYLAMAVNGAEDLTPRFTLGSAPYAGYAQYCDEAETIGGLSADDLQLVDGDVTWAQITDVPAALADGDANTTYTAGSGLTLTNTAFSVTPGFIETAAKTAAFDTQAELIDALTDVYLPAPDVSCDADQVLVADGAGAWNCGDIADLPLDETAVDLLVSNNGYAAAADLTALATRVSTAEGKITALTTRVGTAETGLTALTTRVGTTETGLTGLTTRVGTTEGNVTTLGTRLGTTEGNVTALTTRVGTTETGLTGLTTRVGTAEGTLTALGTRVGTAEGAVSALGTRVGTAETGLTGLTTRVGATESDLTGLTARVDTAAASLALLGSRVGTTETSLGALATRLTTAEGNITGLTRDLADLGDDLSALQADLDDATAVPYLPLAGGTTTGPITSPALISKGQVATQNGQVHRDFLTYNTVSQGRTRIQIKTNIPIKSNTMYRIVVEGYNYGNSLAINSDAVGYTYQDLACVGSNSVNNYAGGVSLSQYCSSDGFVVISLNAGNFYYAGFTVSAMFLNPTGNSFNISGVVYLQDANL